VFLGDALSELLTGDVFQCDFLLGDDGEPRVRTRLVDRFRGRDRLPSDVVGWGDVRVERGDRERESLSDSTEFGLTSPRVLFLLGMVSAT
jgi:hypothetical protein